MSRQINKEFAELIFFNYFPTPENGGVPPTPPVEDLPQAKPEKTEHKSLMPVILVLAAILGVILIAYGYVSTTGFTLNNSQRPAVECADMPDGGVMCRKPSSG